MNPAAEPVPGLSVAMMTLACLEAFGMTDRREFDAQGLEGVGMPPAQFTEFVEKEARFINELARKIKAGTR